MTSVSASETKNTALESYKECSGLLAVHQAIRDGIDSETSGAFQCAIIITVNDSERAESPQVVQLTAFPCLEEIHCSTRNKLLSIQSFVKGFTLNQQYIESISWNRSLYIDETGIKTQYCRGDFIHTGIDIPIFFKDLPSDIFDDESLTEYLLKSIEDAIDVLYLLERYKGKKTLAKGRTVNNEDYKGFVRTFARRFLEETKNAQKGLDFQKD